jgi:uncharacterized damage-inducible protein DinB
VLARQQWKVAAQTDGDKSRGLSSIDERTENGSVPNLCSPSQLMRYKRWADELIFQAVQALPVGELTKERPTLFKTILNTLNHIYVVDLVWRAHLEGRPHGIAALNVVLHEHVEELWRAQREVDAWYVDLSDSLADQALSEAIEFEFIDGMKGKMSRGEILMHVVNHTTYHRGWVADMFFQIPVRPPTTDFPVFLRG